MCDRWRSKNATQRFAMDLLVRVDFARSCWCDANDVAVSVIAAAGRFLDGRFDSIEFGVEFGTDAEGGGGGVEFAREVAESNRRLAV